MPFTDLFSERSQAYAQARPTYPDALYRFIAEAAPGRERAWDCATGSGQAAVGLARHFGGVEATDASAEQVAHAMPAPNVRYSVQPAEGTDFPGEAFDAVTVAQALHWFDLDRFYAEVRRVLRTRGVIAAWGYDWTRITPEIDRAFHDTLLARIEPHWPKQNAVLVAGYRTIAFPFEPIECPRFRIELDWSLAQFLDYAQTWTATRTYVREHGPAIVEETARVLRPLWGEGPRKATMALHARMGRLAR